MSKKESIQADIDTLRSFLLAFLTAIFAVCGYAMINIERLSILQTISGVIALICLIIGFVWIFRQYQIKKKILETIK